MLINKIFRTAFILVLLLTNKVFAQKENLTKQVEQTMLKVTKFTVDKVSYNGGYVWYYLPDLSRHWG